jgi:hypothetical protein
LTESSVGTGELKKLKKLFDKFHKVIILSSNKKEGRRDKAMKENRFNSHKYNVPPSNWEKLRRRPGREDRRKEWRGEERRHSTRSTHNKKEEK